MYQMKQLWLLFNEFEEQVHTLRNIIKILIP